MTKRTVWLVVWAVLLMLFAGLCILRALRGNEPAGGGVYFIQQGLCK